MVPSMPLYQPFASKSFFDLCVSFYPECIILKEFLDMNKSRKLKKSKYSQIHFSPSTTIHSSGQWEDVCFLQRGNLQSARERMEICVAITFILRKEYNTADFDVVFLYGLAALTLSFSSVYSLKDHLQNEWQVQIYYGECQIFFQLENFYRIKGRELIDFIYLTLEQIIIIYNYNQIFQMIMCFL